MKRIYNKIKLYFILKGIKDINLIMSTAGLKRPERRRFWKEFKNMDKESIFKSIYNK